MSDFNAVKITGSERKNRRSGSVIFLSGISIFTLGVWGLWQDIGWIAQSFYAYAWWGYILMLDGFVAVRRGNSILTARREHVFPMILWSISFWYFFELLNLRYKNWYYVGVSQNVFVGFLFSLVCFSTVLIGMFETYEAVTATGLCRNWRGRPGKRFPAWVSYAVQGVGLVMVTLSLVFSTYLAPLVWGSVSFLLDPWNYRRGARSILRDFEQRDGGLVARLLIGGLICGVVWESLNFFAPQKWIYTVRGLENFKLFEMPLLGFLGFPALALDGMAVYSFLSYWFLGNKTWELESDLPYSLKPRCHLPRKVFWASVPVQIACCALILVGVRSVNVASESLKLADLDVLTPEARAELESLGIRRPIRFLRMVHGPEGHRRWAERLGYSEEDFRRVLDEIALLTFKGIGLRHGELLKRIGIHRVEDLVHQTPEKLFQQIQKVADPDTFPGPPRLDMVRVWVLSARNRGIVMKAS